MYRGQNTSAGVISGRGQDNGKGKGKQKETDMEVDASGLRDWIAREDVKLGLETVGRPKPSDVRWLSPE